MLSQYRLLICTSKLFACWDCLHHIRCFLVEAFVMNASKNCTRNWTRSMLRFWKIARQGKLCSYQHYWQIFPYFLTRYSRDRVMHQKHPKTLYQDVPWKVLQLQGMFCGCSVDVSLFLFHEVVFLQEVEPCILCQALVSVGGRLGLCEKQGTTHLKKSNPFKIMPRFWTKDSMGADSQVFLWRNYKRIFNSSKASKSCMQNVWTMGRGWNLCVSREANRDPK